MILDRVLRNVILELYRNIIRENMDRSSGICQPPDSRVAASLADKAPAVLQKYFESTNTFLTQHHISTYEACVFREIPEIIFSENPIVVLKEPLETKDGRFKGEYAYKTEIFIGGSEKNPPQHPADLAIDVGPPIITLDDGKTVRRMFPNEARIRNLTYAAQFFADIVIRVTFTHIENGQVVVDPPNIITIPGFQLFRIPILLRSKLCATNEASPALLQEMGECRNDQGGYFIVDGSEKVLITRQEQAFNTVFVDLKPPSDLITKTYATVVCQHPVTKQTRRVMLYRRHGNVNIEDGVIRASIPFVKGEIPLFVLFRMLGVESDKDIVQMIVPDGNKAAEDSLIPSIHDAWPITTHVHALEFVRTLTKGFIDASVLDIVREQLFSHVPDRPLAKAQYLAEIVRKMLRVENRKEPPTSRDDIRNQRLLPTGILLRGLFRECWKQWQKAVIRAVDIQYNYNRSSYEGKLFLELFTLANLPRILATQELNDSIMRGYRGRWGLSEFTIKKGVIQPLARISYMDSVSHTRRVISDFDTSLKLVGPRHLHPSQVGYFCTSETPTGGHIGATKNMSMLTAISVMIPTQSITDWLFTRGGVIEVAQATKSMFAFATSVQINGGTIGFTEDPATLVYVLKLMKWTGCLSPMASVSFNTAENIVRVYLDDGRPLRPLWHLEHGKWSDVASAKELPSWRDLFMGTLDLTKDLSIYSVEFRDPFENNEKATLADYIELLNRHKGAIEFVDPYEGNESYVSWWGNQADLTSEHTHAEIHPSTMMGVLASMIPFANHNQSPRNQLSCSQSKQAIGYYSSNYENRFDTYGSMLCYGEGALCRTIYHDAIAGGGMPYGTNIIFCINSFNGYNQDDGILFNRSSIQRGLFRSLSLRSYETVEEDDSMAKMAYRVGNPKYVLAWSDLHPGYDYTQLDENGIIREGAFIHEKSVLVGRYAIMNETGKVVDASLLPTVFTKGRVDKVVVLHQANGLKLVKVRILEERVPELGDKFSSRHGQKGTMGMLMDAEDMPRTADGMVPDVMVNPHCIPSRMTMAQLLEQLFGKLGAQIGAKMNATSFMNDEQSFQAIGDALEAVGLQRAGEEIMYSGITGVMFSSSVFMGPLNFMRLKHLAQDKINARGAGRREQKTHQPTGGRGNEGGMRIGEMERDVLIAHGVTEFLHESMMKRSDGTEVWICNGCGTIPIYNESEGLFVCAQCDGPLTYQGNTSDTIGLVLPVKKSRCTFSRVQMPYATKLLDQELTTFMNGGFRFLTGRGVRHFREPEMEALAEEITAEMRAETEELMEAVEKKSAKIGALPKPVIPPDHGAEDETEDREDDGQPERNESDAVVAPVDGQAAIDFDATKNKEFGSYFPVKMQIGDKEWSTVEHYFQAMKFTSNPAYQETIRTAKTPAAAKRFGKTTDVPIRQDWMKVRDDIMLEAVRIKFKNEKLRAKLLATGTSLIRDLSPQDNYWGVGRSGKGQNKLGKILMKVREEIQSGADIQAPAEVPQVPMIEKAPMNAMPIVEKAPMNAMPIVEKAPAMPIVEKAPAMNAMPMEGGLEPVPFEDILADKLPVENGAVIEISTEEQHENLPYEDNMENIKVIKM